MRLLLQRLLLTSALLFAPAAFADNPIGSPDDHFMCYKARNSPGESICAQGEPNEGQLCSDDSDCGGGVESCVKNKFTKFDVPLDEPLDGAGSFTVVKPKWLCAPADKNDEGVVDLDTHLRRYRIKAAPGEPKHVKQTGILVVNQFGEIEVDTIKADSLMVPAAKDLSSATAAPNPGDHSVDHHKCFKVKVSKKTPKFLKGVQADVLDQFQDRRYDLKKPTKLCIPVDKDGEGVKNPDGHFLCYRSKIAKNLIGQPPALGDKGLPINPPQAKHTKVTGIYANDQFGPERVDTIKDDELCVPSVIPTAAAREITDPSDLIGGPLARGRIGDFYIENLRLRAVIQAPQRNFSSGVGQFGGNVIDVDLQREEGDPDRDLFEEWSVLINLENTANYQSVVVLNDGSNGSPAVIRATGPDDLLDRINASSTVEDFGFPFEPDLNDTDQPIEITTDYILGAADDYLTMETTITNTSGTDIDLFLGDFLSPLAQEVFHPGYGYGEPLVSTKEGCDPGLPCDFIAYAGEGATGGVSYGYITEPGSTDFNTNGVQVALREASALGALLGSADPNFTVPAMGTRTITRYLAVADGDVGGIVDIRNRIRGLATGTVSGQVLKSGVPVANAEVSVVSTSFVGADPEGAFLLPPTQNVSAAYRTDANGEFEGTLPAGDYSLRVHKDGHLFASPDPANISITASNTTVQNFTFSEPGRIRVTIVDENSDPIAGRITVVGFDPAVDPDNTQSILVINNRTGLFEDAEKDQLGYGLTRMLFTDQSGDSGEFDIEPGQYQVVVSHGTEYSAYKETVNVASGALVNVAAQVVPVIDTSGFISGDFHVHSFDSVDSRVTRRDRILSMLSAGVDFFTPSDHEFKSDFTPDLAELGVDGLISVAVANEITPFDYGHFNAFPLTIDPAQVNGGAIDWGRAAPPGMDFPSYGNYGLSPGEIFATASADPGFDLVGINHVHSFFDGGLLVDTGVSPPQSNGDPTRLRLDPSVPNFWDEDFHAMEIWIEPNRSQIFGNFLGENAGNWFNLLNQGFVRSGYSDSDTHQLVSNLAGFPRTFIASPTDDPASVGPIAETIAMNLADGHAIGTNGPFIRISAEGDAGETGGIGLDLGGVPLDTLVRATGGSGTLTVEIQSPAWAEFDSVEFYVNSGTIAQARAGLPPLYRICPDTVHTDGVEFTKSSVAVNGSSRWEASTTLSLAGLTEDTWVVVMVKGTDGVSEPVFPVQGNDLNPDTALFADLIDSNVGEEGVPALAFSNPIFFDVDGNGSYDPPGLQFQGACP